jgi:hypothetical protein
VKDTPDEIDRRFRKILLQRSGEERLKMGCSMHATAMVLAKASILQRHSRARPAAIKRLLFIHFYGNDFEPEERERIASALAKRGRPDGQERKLAMSDVVREKAERYRRKRKGKAKGSRPSSR